MSHHRWYLRIALAVGVVTMTACSGGSSKAGPANGSARRERSAAAAASGTYRNPVYDSNFPDPGVIRVGDTYHAFGTQGGSSNIQTLTSKDLVHWTPGPDALPELGSWALTGNTWAPEVIQVGNECHMYYVARAEKQGVQPHARRHCLP